MPTISWKTFSGSICTFMMVAALSDLHGYLPRVPRCDLLLLGGDLCPDGSERDQARWLDTTFRRWLLGSPAREVVAVAGNHDFVFANHPEWVPRLPWHYLQDSGVQLLGWNIWGSPWQPVFFDWAFNLTENDLAKKWQLIPPDTDILVLHGPPYEAGDLTFRGNRTGSPSLRSRIEAVQPSLVICGHIHEGRGIYHIGASLVANVSQVDSRYDPVSEVWTYILPDRPAATKLDENSGSC